MNRCCPHLAFATWWACFSTRQVPGAGTVSQAKSRKFCCSCCLFRHIVGCCDGSLQHGVSVKLPDVSTSTPGKSLLESVPLAMLHHSAVFVVAVVVVLFQSSLQYAVNAVVFGSLSRVSMQI